MPHSKFVRKEVKPELRFVLDQIQQWLLDPAVADDLWAVLTALRGPDNGRYKEATTCWIRSTAFPVLAERLYEFGAVFYTEGAEPAGKETLRMFHTAVSTHFQHHYLKALAALGFKEVYGSQEPTS